MSLLKTINDEFKQAMRDKDDLKLTVLRQLKSSFTNESIVLKKKDDGITDEEALKVVKREAKKRRDSISQFTDAGRDDLADNEAKELEIIEKFLPEEMSEDSIREVVSSVIADSGADKAQFGQIMSEVMSRIGGQADGGTVSKVVKELLR